MRVALLGDICLTGKFDLESNPEALTHFNKIKPVLEECDLVVGNLESPFTKKDSSLVCKAIHIKSAPVNTRLLQHLGVDAVSLANNHIFDYGRNGYRSTLVALEEAGIGYFGTEGQSLTFEKNDQKVMLGGFCCLSAHPSKSSSRGVNVLTPASFEKFLQAAQAAKAFPVSSVHWGDENIHYPREEHVCFARQMASRNDFLLHGHHPHVVHGLEMSNRSLIAYSLGNFCTDKHSSRSVRHLRVTQTAANLESYLLMVTIEDGKISKHEIIPIENNGAGLTLSNQAIGSKISGYSSALKRPYKRPAKNLNATPRDREAPARFSFSWWIRRLNYHFIGAYLKGMANRIRYRLYFSKYVQ